ncbi:MAG: phosphotransferase [Bacteroidales bacterium]|nr:phosphotransferase [Bacteroidales bacterium]
MEQLKRLFAAWAGVPCAECLALGANGSSRRYYRLVANNNGPISAIGCVADDLRENEAFFAYSRHFFNRGIPVPELYAVDDDRRHYLQQDLGDQTLYGLLREKKQQGGGFDAEMLALYKQALSDLHNIQVAGRDMDFSYGYPRAAFDQRSILWDLNYFKYYYLKLQHIPFDEDRLQDDFKRFADLLLSADCNYFLYRDFQGRNIMIRETTEPSTSHLYYIDYQGGRRGAAQYDVASLLYSAKSDLPEAIRQELLQHYVALHGDPDFMQHFWHYVVVRILQTLGAYGYRGLYERKPYFIESIPLAVGNLRRIIEEHPLPSDLHELNTVLTRLCQQVQPLPAATSDQLTVSVQSFSYRQGLPSDSTGNGGGHIFDCRALPNPGRYPEYKSYTGKDRPVIDFLCKEAAVDQFIDHAMAIVSQSVDKYLERHFSHLSVSFGCTGGQHRSVYCAERLAAQLRQKYPEVNVVLTHREQDKQ